MKLKKIIIILIPFLLYANQIQDQKIDQIFLDSPISFSKEDKLALINISDNFKTSDPALILLKMIKDIEYFYQGLSSDEKIKQKATNDILKIENLIKKKIFDYVSKGFSTSDAVEETRKDTLSFLPKSDDQLIQELKIYIKQYLDSFLEESFFTMSENKKRYSLMSIYQKNLVEVSDLERLQFLDSEARYNSDLGVKFPEYPRKSLSHNYSLENIESFSARVKLSFLGSEISTGPTILFKRRYQVYTKLTAPGDDQIIKYSKELGARILNHNKDRRIVVQCYIVAQASHKLEGEANLSIMGSGVRILHGEWNQLVVEIHKRISYAPFHNPDGTRTSYQDVVKNCENGLLKEYKESIDIELKLAASELVYSNPLNQCVEDKQCLPWFNDYHPLIRIATVPRCVEHIEESGSPYNYCNLRTIKGQPCPYYVKGKRVTAGYFEYPCDKRLKCTLTQKGSFFTRAEAICK